MTLADQLSQVDGLQQVIAAYGELSPEITKRINYKFRLDWNFYSNAIEGGTLSREETRSIMVGNITVDDKPLRDVLEMNGHDEVVKEILAMGRGNKRISESRIKNIHRAILHEEDPEKQPLIGKWKTTFNQILNYKGEKFDFAPPDEVAERIHQLLNKTNAALDALEHSKKAFSAKHPIMIALEFHLEYVTIHPFYDGNGRTGRILMNLLLISLGYPPIIIRTSDKEAYSRYLADVQAYGGPPDLFFKFMAGLLIRSQQLVLDAIAGKDIDEPDDWEKQLSLLKQQTKEWGEVEPKSEELLYQRFQDSFHPLIEKARLKLARFDEWFVAYGITVQLKSPDAFNHDSSLEERIEQLKKKGELTQLYEIQVLFNWKGFKAADIAPFEMGAAIKIEMYHEFNYQITAGNDKSVTTIEKLYTQALNQAEISGFIDQLGTTLVKRMEQRMVENRR